MVRPGVTQVVVELKHRLDHAARQSLSLIVDTYPKNSLSVSVRVEIFPFSLLIFFSSKFVLHWLSVEGLELGDLGQLAALLRERRPLAVDFRDSPCHLDVLQQPVLDLRSEPSAQLVSHAPLSEVALPLLLESSEVNELTKPKLGVVRKLQTAVRAMSIAMRMSTRTPRSSTSLAAQDAAAMDALRR